MRFDLITIFPQYFDSLNVSLLGKARRDGIVQVCVHDLRNWAYGKHLSVDDSPAGGGAGMVMRPDVWGEALDKVLNAPVGDILLSNCLKLNRVLAIPTPSGKPLKQSDLEELASADQIVVACGRYEGVDSRVADFYENETGIRTFQFSLGDYILNGGEVAALALVEGVSRLLPGVLGNPKSLVQESHSPDGLLQGPAYTHPRLWRGLETPPVLLSGDHQKIGRWRRDQALRRTARVRPDMIRDLAFRGSGGRGHLSELSSKDLDVLAREGYVLVPHFGRVTFGELSSSVSISSEDYRAVARVGERMFPLPCPPRTSLADMEAFVEEHLTEEALRNSVHERGARMCVARVSDSTVCEEIVGYTLMFPEAPKSLVKDVCDPVYLSKIYVETAFHGSGVAGALLNYALVDAQEAWGKRSVVLGTNVANRRAIKFYKKYGFHKGGTHAFKVGGELHKDDVFVLDLTDKGSH